MARSHLTLAALASSALPGIDIRAAEPFTGSGHGEYDSALVTAADGSRLVVRVPTSDLAEIGLAGDVYALANLSAGIRSRLPFDVQTVRGQVVYDGTRAVVYEYVEGRPIDIDELRTDSGLPDSIGRAIGAIHGLPTSFVADAGLPVLSAAECAAEAVAVIERSADTGHVPAALVTRWEEASADSTLWQFDTTVVHGSMTADSFLATGESVSAVLGFSALRVGDPARDLHWLLGASSGASQTALAAYGRMRSGVADRMIRQRALLYAELEVARWLLHGTDLDDGSIIDDAVSMLDGLVDSVHADLSSPLSTDTGPILAVSEVEELLERTPGARSRDGHARGLSPVTEDNESESSRSE